MSRLGEWLRDAGDPPHQPHLSVGINTADWLSMGDQLRLLEEGGAELIHIDVMDGCFCPTLTLGPSITRALKTSLLKDVHLMINEPLAQVQSFIEAGSDLLTFHVEATMHPRRILQVLQRIPTTDDDAQSIVRGVALNPGTPVVALEPLLDEVELIVILAVNPGWSGQTFAASTPRRVEAVRRLVDAAGRKILLSVDGGVTKDNIADVVALRPDVIVSGSAIFDGANPASNLRYMLDALGGAQTTDP